MQGKDEVLAAAEAALEAAKRETARWALYHLGAFTMPWRWPCTLRKPGPDRVLGHSNNTQSIYVVQDCTLWQHCVLPLV